MHRTQNTEHRESVIDFLKGICILLVCLTHYAWEGAERRALLFSWWVDMAVPVFMILSGYVYAKSIRRKKIDRLSHLFSYSDLVKKTIRFTMPILIVFLLTVIWDANKYTDGIPYEIFKTFLQGGRGQGAYYYPLMMQAIFVLPVIGILVTRHEEKGLLICLFANIAYEVLHVAYNVPVESYRLLVFRYIFILAAGCYIALEKKMSVSVFGGMFCSGFLFLYAYLYMGYKPRYVIHWTGTCFLAAMYMIPIVCILIRKFKLRLVPIEFLGKASYHIFAMQMLYYYTVAPLVYQSVQNRKVQLLLSMGCCVCSGVLFYFVETPVSKFLQNKVTHKFKVE